MRSRTADHVDVTQVLSQDVVLGGPVVVDTTRRKPVLAFHDPGEKASSDSDGHQALVFCPRKGPVPDIRHVARALGTPTGWSVTSPFEKWLQEQAKQPGWAFNDLTVWVAPENGSRKVRAEFCTTYTSPSGDRPLGQMFISELSEDGTSWTTPSATLSDLFDTIDTTYTSKGYPIRYRTRKGGPWGPRTGIAFRGDDLDSPGVLAPDGVTMVALSDSEVVAAGVVDGALVAQRQTPATPRDVTVDTLPFQPKHVVGGFPMGERGVFLVTDSHDGLWSVVFDPDVNLLRSGQQFNDKGTRWVDSHPATDGGHNVFFIDADRICWKSRVTFQGTEAAIPLQKDVAVVATPGSVLETATVFLVEAGTESGDETKNELRLDVQDSTTGLWRRVHVHDPAAGVKEVTRYRVEATVLDRSGAPVAGQPVTLSRAPGDTEGEVAVDGQIVEVTDRPTPLKTDLFGRVTLAVTPTGLSAPDLVLRVEGLQDVLLRPSRDTEDYLRGTKNLKYNLTSPAGPLPDFGGGTLAGAKAPGPAGRPGKDALAPEAAKSKKTAQEAADAIKAMAETKAGSASRNSFGFRLSVTLVDGTPQVDYVELQEPETLDDSWEKSPIVFGDVHAGLQTGAITEMSITFSWKDKFAKLWAKFKDGIKKLVTLGKDAIQAILGFIGSVFKMIGAKLGDVVGWLTAWFDFPAIWNTKKVFESSVLTMLDKAQAAVKEAGNLADDYLRKQKDSVRKSFKDARAKLGDKTVGSYDDLPGKGEQGTLVVGDAKLSDLNGGNAHLNWFQDKAAVMTIPPRDTDKDIVDNTTWDTCAPLLKKAGEEFVTGVRKLLEAFTDLAAKPQDLKATTLAALLESFEQLALAALDFGDAVLHAVVDLVSKAIDKLKTALTAPREVPVIGTLWKWIAQQAGEPDAPLTVNGALCFLGALPVTLIYRLIKGKGAEPFPKKNALLQAQARGAVPKTLTPTDKTWLLVAAILQTVQFAFYAAGDLLAYESAQGLDWPYLGPLVQVANLLFTLVVFDIGTTVLAESMTPGWVIALVATLFALAFAVLAVVYRSAAKAWLTKLRDAGDPVPVLLMLKGCFWDLYRSLARIVDGTTEDGDEAAARVLLAISPATALLNNRIMLKEPDSGFVIATVKAGVDTFFTVLGGVMLCRHYDKH
ncbi:hypothetical protein AB0E96_03790 [Kitasatospora sp. NPDC036755]|uniref:hypothetical protein n=1 Tax=Kitasatospora sp. NPDC036755 TaxID=3154600 RepID=UPI0033FA9358